VVCAASMFAASAVEWRRLALYQGGHYYSSREPGLGRMKIVDMSVFWQVPQYLLVGLSEVRDSTKTHTFTLQRHPVVRSCLRMVCWLCVGVAIDHAAQRMIRSNTAFARVTST